MGEPRAPGFAQAWVVAIATFAVAETPDGSGVALIAAGDEEKPSFDGSPCVWWRRGRVDLDREHQAGVLLAA